MSVAYEGFLESKKVVARRAGKEVAVSDVHPLLFPFQRDVVVWAVRKGQCAVFLDTGLGKAQPIDERVLTPEGWRAIGTLVIGDEVIGGDGKPTGVMGVYPQGKQQIATIEFTDGARVEATLDHLWLVTTDQLKSRGKPWRTMTTRDIANTLCDSSGRIKWRVPIVSVQMQEAILPLDSYVLGVLIGDGCLSAVQCGPTFTTADEEVVQRVNDRLGLPYAARHNSTCTDRTPSYRITRERGIGVGSRPSSILNTLKNLGLWGCGSADKFIPSIYLTASETQRLDLLHGLMDTDGWTGTATQYTTVSKTLATDIQELVRSLGGTARLTSKIPIFVGTNGEKKKGKRAYNITVKMPVGVNPFSLSRKAEHYNSSQHTPPVRKIKSIIPIDSKEAVCIQVAASHQTYVTRDYVVTHNTFVQLEWARLLGQNTLIIAPLSVARQTVREGTKIGLEVRYVRDGSQIVAGCNLWITNYELIDRFDFSVFGAVVCDESSIMKGIDGKTRKRLMDLCKDIPYRLCCTATPAPNDYTEIGQHAQFLGVCTMSEMIAMFFVNANKEHTFTYGNKMYHRKGQNKGGQEWRLKHHAEIPFFKWLSSWAITMMKPSDLGYDDDGFILPPLNIYTHFITAEYQPQDKLMFTHLGGVKDRNRARASTVEGRLLKLKELVNAQDLCYNLGHEYTTEKQGIPEKISRETQETAERTIQGTCAEHDPRTENCTQRVHEGIQITQHEQMETDIRTTSEGQCPQKGIVCTGRVEENCCATTGQELATFQPGKTEGTATEEVSNITRGNAQVTSRAERQMRDLRVFEYGEPELLPTSGSLPRNRSDKRATLLEVQLRPGIVPELPQSVKESDRVSGDQWVIWCGLDIEQRAVEKMLGDQCISIYGSLTPEEKERRLEIWLSGGARFLLSKPKCCGFGLNLQVASRMVFFGLSDSWEMYYQCIRREWRYRQEHPVDVHIIMSDIEAEVYQNVMRKDAMANRLREKLIEQIRTFEEVELERREAVTESYVEMTVKEENWTAMMGDSCKRLSEIMTDSVSLAVFSPPFADLFTYSDSERDLGNSKGWNQFFEHFAFIIRELLRVTKPGRLNCVHTSDIPAMASRDGYIGVRDFPGEVIRAYEKEGWTFVGRAFVDKSPQAQAIRVKSKALLFVQLRKDSASSRPALIDQILFFRKPGDNAVPVTPVENGEMDNEIWIKWAHGIWLGISETDTLQYAPARGVGDEKHVCPLQLGTIERCIKLYSNPGETVLTPFGGIGSEAVMALKLRRKAILIELKQEYFMTALKNMREVDDKANTPDLFSVSGITV